MIKQQICIVHGGSTFPSLSEFRQSLEVLDLDYERLLYAPSWKNWLSEQLPEADVLLPQMPNKQNAQYDEWKVLFEKVLVFLSPDATLIGHSLGGVFLAKYFSENPSDYRYKKIILVAAPYDDETGESLGDFGLSSASGLAGAAQEIRLLYSRDDQIVPVTELDKYKQDLPAANIHLFDDRGHFNIPEFPELLAIISSA